MKRRRKFILESHKRCEVHGIDPYCRRLKHALAEKDLRLVRNRHKTLLDAASPYLALTAETLSGCESLLALVNREGYIIKLVGQPTVLESRRKLGLREGTSLNEKDAGTNAAMLCLRTRVPFFISGREYFLKILQKGSCYAAPIVDGDCVSGAVIIIHPQRTHHPHTFALVQTLAQLISREYKEIKEGDSIMSMCDALNTGVVITTRRGKVLYLNMRARHLLRTTRNSTIAAYFTKDILASDELVNEVIYSNHTHSSFCVTRKEFNKDYLFLFESTEEKLKGEKTIKTQLAPYNFDDILGLQELKKKARHLAMGDMNILIIGESGTGKELIASAIHNTSTRAGSRFVVVNCAAIPETLFESELFGYKKGAFTDARCDRMGRIEYASGGTLFLDEIGDLPINVQSKLLRVIEDRCVTPLGSNVHKKVDVRFIFATNQDLKSLIYQKKFREDLYYRINTPVIKIAPLRERKHDIKGLVHHFIKLMQHEHSRFIDGISDEALSAFLRHGFPGNVRELQGIIRNAYLVCRDDIIGINDLEISRNDNGFSFKKRLLEYGAEIIQERLHVHKNNVKAVARELGVSTRTIYRYLRKLTV